MVRADTKTADDQKLMRSFKHTLGQTCLRADTNRVILPDFFHQLVFGPSTCVEVDLETLLAQHTHGTLTHVLQQQNANCIRIEWLENTWVCVIVRERDRAFPTAMRRLRRPVHANDFLRERTGHILLQSHHRRERCIAVLDIGCWQCACKCLS